MGAEPEPLPNETKRSPWRTVSFIAEAHLSGKNLFDLDFEHAPGEARHGTLWIATSDGLVRYDGYHWRRFGTSDGLPSDFVRCVRAARDGSIWVGTDRGAGVFDGRSFRTMGSESGLAGPNVRRISEDPDGTLWFCSDSWPDAQARGGLTSYQGGQWRKHGMPEGLPSEYVLSTLRTAQGDRYAVTLAGVVKWNGEIWEPAFEAAHDPRLTWSGAAIAETASDGVTVSSGQLLYQLREGKWVRSPFTDRHDYGLCGTSDGSLYTTLRVESGRKAFARLTPEGWVVESAGFPVGHDYIENLREAPDGSLWAVGFDTLVKWERRSTEWRQFDEVWEPRFLDGSGRAWFGHMRGHSSAGGRPVRWSESEGWSRLEAACDDLQRDGRGNVWGISSGYVNRWEATREVRTEAGELGLEALLLGRADRSQQFWVVGRRGDGNAGAAWWDGVKWSRRELVGLTPGFTLRAGAGGRDGVWVLVESPGSTQTKILKVGREANREWEIPSASLGLFRVGMTEDRGGGVWIYGDNGLMRSRTGEGPWEPVPGMPSRLVFACEERDDGIWLGCNGATGGRGALLRIRGEEWREYPLGLLFHAAVSSVGELVTVGPGHLIVVPSAADAEPVRVALPVEETMVSAMADGLGGYWVGSDERVFRFTPSREPPETRVNAATDQVIEGERWRVEATAIPRFAPVGARNDSRFSWRLDGGPWSPPRTGGDRVWETSGLPSGVHQVEVRAHGFGSLVDATPARLSFRVFPVPMQSRPWFIPAVGGVAVMMGVLAMAAYAARRRVAGYASILERRVAERSAGLEEDVAKRMRVEARLSRLVMTAPGAICAFRMHEDGRCWFEYVSPQIESVLGVSASELARTADPAFARVVPDDRDRLWDSVLRAGRELTLWYHVFRVEHAVRGKVWIEGRASPEPSPDGSILWHGFLVDVSERIQAEESRRVLEAQLRQSQKLEAIGTLAGGIAHDFNNILAAILGNLDCLRHEVGRNTEAGESVEEIRRASLRAKSLVQQILTFGRGHSPERRAVDVRAVMAETVGMLRATLPASVELTSEVAADCPAILGDVTQMQQVLMNLATNAWHALEGRQGSIRLAARGHEIEGSEALELGLTRMGRYVRIEVRDTGKGMDAATRERIFEPFFTTKESGAGTGLGLSVVHGIVRSHEGAIRVTSALGSGTCVAVFFPVAAGEALASVPVSPTPPAGATLGRDGEGRHLLYLDDERPLVMVATRMLKRMGYRVTGFSDPAAAMDALRKAPLEYDLVITDLNMPAMTGLAVATALREVRPDLPVVLSSGVITDGLRDEAAKAGIRALLAKPHTIEELNAVLLELLPPLARETQ